MVAGFFGSPKKLPSQTLDKLPQPSTVKYEHMSCTVAIASRARALDASLSSSCSSCFLQKAHPKFALVASARLWKESEHVSRSSLKTCVMN